VSELEVGYAFIKYGLLYLQRNLPQLATGSVLIENISPDSSYISHSMITARLNNLVTVVLYSLRQAVNQP
jgi:hypothetical protein